jgi:hypothetical protein
VVETFTHQFPCGQQNTRGFGGQRVEFFGQDGTLFSGYAAMQYEQMLNLPL